MSYKAPGAYARFVTAPTPVSDPREVRALAIIGTGETSYSVVNEVVLRSSSGIADEISNSGVYEVSSVTSKPLYQGVNYAGAVSYTKGDYEKSSLSDDFVTSWGQEITEYWDVEENASYAVVDDKYIVWKMDIVGDSLAEVDLGNIQRTMGASAGSQAFGDVDDIDPNNSKVVVHLDMDKLYLLKSSSYRFEVTYVGGTGVGMYSVVNELTKEVIGEYVADGLFNLDVVPGLKIKVNATTESVSNTISVNDYCIFTITPPVVQREVDVDGVVVVSPLAPYYSSYTYTKPSTEYGPKVFYTYDDIVNEYGNYDVAANGTVVNSLSLAAEIAMTNGAAPIVCVQARSNTEGAFLEAISELSKPFLGLRNVNAVIALTDGLSTLAHDRISQKLSEHVEDMALPLHAKERIAYVSAAKGDTYQKLATFNPITSTDGIDYRPSTRFNSERTVFVASQGASKDIKDIRTGRVVTRNLTSSYVTAAVAALSLKSDPAEPLTNKTIFGFKNLLKLYSESEMNGLAESGCLVLKQDSGVIRVRHGITTSTNDINSSEITLVQIKDYVMDNVRLVLGETYIGNKLKPSILGDIKSSLITILNGYRGRSIILGYSGVSVKRSTLDPRQIDIRFEIEAVYPLNYIDITFSFSGVS